MSQGHIPKGLPGPSPEQCKDLLMNAPMSIFISTPDGRFLSANAAMARMLGYDSPQELIEIVTDIAAQLYVDPADRAEFIRLLEVQDEVVNLEYSFRRRNGQEFRALVNANAVRDHKGKVIAYQGFSQDITERKAAEECLQYTLYATNDGIWDCNLVNNEFQYAGRFAEMLGYKQGEVDNLGCFCEHNIHPDDAMGFQKAFKDYVDGRTSSYELEFRLKTKDGDYKWIYTRGRALQRDTAGRALRVIGTHTDITQRKRTEKALRESEEKYRRLFETMSQGVI